MEAPIASNGKLIVDHKYLSHLVSVANEKMVDNNSRIDRFYHTVKPLGVQNAGPVDTPSLKHIVDDVDDIETDRTDELHCSSECTYNPNNSHKH